MLRERRRVTNLVMALVAMALGLIAQGYFAHWSLSDGLILYAIAAALFIYAFRQAVEGAREAFRLLPSGEEKSYFAPWEWGLFLLPIPLFLCLAALRYFGRNVHLSWAWILYLLSILCFLITGRVMEGRDRFPATDSRLTPLDVALLLGITALAAFMRFYNFDSIPFGTWYDEADNGLQVLKMLRDPTYRPLYVPSTNLPAHFLYLIALSFKLFGVSTLSIRAVTAIMGVATAVAAYFLGRELFGRRLAPVLAFLLAVSRWDVNFSRIGLHGVSTPLFEIVALYFLLKGLRSRRPLDFAWGGVATGLGLCFYAPYRLFPVVIALFLLCQMICQRGFLRQHYLGLLLFALGVLLAFAPVAQFALQKPDIFWARTHRVSVFTAEPGPGAWEEVGRNAYKHLLMFNYQGDPNGRHNLPGKPMLDFASSTLFVLGLAYSLYRWRETSYFLLIIWFAVTLCGGVFSLPFEAPQSLRAIGTLPVAYILACVPLALMERESRQALGHLGEWAFILTLLPFLALVGWDNYNVYFNIQARDFAVWNAFSTRETIIAQEVNRLGDGYDIYLAPILTNHLTTQFLAPDFKEHLVLEPTTTLPLRRSGREGVALFIDPDSWGTSVLVESYYPQATIKEFRSPDHGPVTLYLYLLTPDDVERVQGLSARYYRGEGADIAPLYRESEVLDFNWLDEAALPLPFRAEWMGTLLAPAYGQYSFSFEAPGQVELWLDGISLLAGSRRVTRTVTLAKGLHALRIRCTVAEPGLLRLRWRPPQAEDLTVVPREALYRPPVTANGLLGSYYPNDEWAEPPAFVRIDPRVDFYFHLIPLPRPYTVGWQGQIDIPAAGTYRLGAEVLDACWLYIDGELLLENLQPNHYKEATIDLTAGRHDIRLRFLDRTDHSHIYLYWTTPDGVKEIVPHERLFPPEKGVWTEAEGR